MPIYFSTGGYKNEITFDVVKKILNHGIKNIELSGTSYSENTSSNLQKLLNEANFQIHNYFPPPKKPFVLNLASMDREIYEKSINHIFNAVEMCETLNSDFYSFHAGFLCDIKVQELGKKVESRELQNRQESILLFIDRVNKVSEKAKNHGVNIMIENNVLSKNNSENFNDNPFLMCDADECLEVINNCPKNVKLLVDVAHLKVSANSLNFNKEDFLTKCNNIIGGYHLSDNDGLTDSNNRFDEDSWFWKYLNKDLNYYSIEVYNLGFEEILELYNLAKKNLTKK